MDMPFGRYRGRPLSEVPLDYLEWALSVAETDHLYYAIEDEIDRRTQQRTHTGRGVARPCPHPSVARDLIGAGLRSMARMHHPDAGGRHEDMIRVTAVADWLRDRVGAT